MNTTQRSSSHNGAGSLHVNIPRSPTARARNIDLWPPPFEKLRTMATPLRLQNYMVASQPSLLGEKINKKKRPPKIHETLTALILPYCQKIRRRNSSTTTKRTGTSSIIDAVGHRREANTHGRVAAFLWEPGTGRRLTSNATQLQQSLRNRAWDMQRV